MNILKFLPKNLRRKYGENIIGAGIRIDANEYMKKVILNGFILSLVISIALFFLNLNPILVFLASFFFLEIFSYFNISLKAMKRRRKMEEVFPEFIQLMSSNLRAGMTVDQAFLSSARKELEPLNAEILKAGKEVTTGKDIIAAFKDMSKRIGSEKIDKVIYLIISGLKAGGNIANLLETTASNMREKEFLEKRASSNVLMYIIFISVAICIGAPLLFGLSSILIEIIIKLTSQLPSVSTSQISLPFTLSTININPRFIIYFSLIFLIFTDIISSLVIGLVNKGDEKYGLSFLLPLIIFSVAVFFGVRLFLFKFLADIFSSVS